MALEEVGARLSLRDRVRFGRDARGAAEDVESIGDAADRTADELERAERRARRAGEVFGTILGRGAVGAARGLGRLVGLLGRGLVVGLGALATGAAVVGFDLVKLSGQLEATGAKARVVFGDQLGNVTRWAETSAAKMGLTTSEAVGMAAGFADLLIPMGFARSQAAKLSSETIGLAGALSQWSGGARSATEVADILAGAMLGETDALKGLGIGLSAADVTARMAAKGQAKLTGAAQQQAQALAIQELIFEKSTDAQAAYAAGGLKVQGAQARIGAAAKTLREELAKRASPYIVEVLGWLESKVPIVQGFLDRFATAAPAAFRLNGATGVVDLLDGMVGAGGRLGDAFRKAKTVGEDAFVVLRDVILPKVAHTLGLVSTALGVVADHAGTAYVLVRAWAAYKVAALAARGASVALAVGQGIAAAATGNLTRAAGLSTAGQKAHLIATRALTVGQKVAAVASRGLAVATRAVSLAFALSPVGVVVVALGLLAAGLVLAYRKSETFRSVVIGAFRAVGGFILSAVDKWLAAYEAVFGFLGKLPGPAGAPFRAMSGAIGDARTKLDGLAATLDELGQPHPVPLQVTYQGAMGQAALAAKLGRLDGRATGGPLRPGRPTLVGERGPELIVPQSAGYVLTAQRTAAAALGGLPALEPGLGGELGGVVVNVGTIVEARDPARTYQQVRQAVRDELARR